MVRGVIILGVVCCVTLFLFAFSIYLMSTVDPEPLTTTNMPTTPGRRTPPLAPLARRMDPDDDDYDDTIETTTVNSRTPVSVTRKGRRSIIDSTASRGLPAVVILQVLDEEKQPRVEIVLRSKFRETFNNQIKYKRKSSVSTSESNAKMKVAIELRQNDKIQIMADDTVLIENFFDLIQGNIETYNMKVLQYTKTHENELINEKLSESVSDNKIYTTISENMYVMEPTTETYDVGYPASVPFTAQYNLRRNTIDARRNFKFVHKTSKVDSKKDSAKDRIPADKTVTMDDIRNEGNLNDKVVSTVDTTRVLTRTSQIMNMNGTLHTDTANTEHTIMKDNLASESVIEDTTNPSSEIVSTEDATSNKNLDNDTFITKYSLEVSNPSNDIFMSDNGHLGDNLAELNAASEIVSTENIINISSSEGDKEETLNNSNLATENIYTEDTAIISNHPSGSINIEDTSKKELPIWKTL